VGKTVCDEASVVPWEVHSRGSLKVLIESASTTYTPISKLYQSLHFERTLCNITS